MDCFGDFCLSCDRQTNGAVYCSQACRLAELDHALISEPVSPTSTSSSLRSPEATRSTCSKFFLTPPFDFSAYRTSSSKPRPASLPISTSHVSTSRQAPSLSPSSSQNSLHSLQSTRTRRGRLSEEAENELKSYAKSFDQTRTLRRRISLQ